MLLKGICKGCAKIGRVLRCKHAPQLLALLSLDNSMFVRTLALHAIKAICNLGE